MSKTMEIKITMTSTADDVSYGEWYEAKRALGLPIGTGDHPDLWAYDYDDEEGVHTWTIKFNTK